MSSADVQPGRRAAAPGELAEVQAFINTSNIEARKEQLETPKALRDYLAARGLLSPRARVTEDDLARALELREALRALTAANNGEPLDQRAARLVDEAAHRAGLIAGFGPTGEPRTVATAAGIDGALGELLAIVQRALSADTWSRLKACREHGCRWSFYDHSRNRSGTWCTMSLCGTRSKMRTYRARRDAAPAT